MFLKEGNMTGKKFILLIAAALSFLTVQQAQAQGWSYVAGAPGSRLFAVWGSSVTDVFAVGHYGTIWQFDNETGLGQNNSEILHYNGTAWEGMGKGISKRLSGIWGSAANNVFAVGEGGTILQYDGSSWTAMATGITGTLSGIWGDSPNDVFAVGSNGTILHYNGSSWASMPSGTSETLTGVWGASASDVFAVGSNGIILHYDRTSWRAMASGTKKNLSGICGRSGSNVFAVGDKGTVLKFNGAGWRPMLSGSRKNLYGIWGSSGTDIYAVGEEGAIVHYNGIFWSPMQSGTTADLYGVCGSSATDIFVAGAEVYNCWFSVDIHALVLHYDGIKWSEKLGNTSVSVDFKSVWTGPDGSFFAAAWDQIVQYTGSTYAAMFYGSQKFFTSIWGSSGTDVFAAASGGGAAASLLHYDGSAWSVVQRGSSEFSYEALWGSSGSDVFAVGVNAIAHYNGTSWSSIALDEEEGLEKCLWGVWGSSGTDVFAVGDVRGEYSGNHRGLILHYNGVSWSEMPDVINATLQGVWGSSGTDVFAVGTVDLGKIVDGVTYFNPRSIILHYNGTDWSVMDNSSTEALSAVWGSSGSDVYAVGEHGAMLHYNGTSWAVMDSGTNDHLAGIWGNSGSDLYAVGDNGIILHYGASRSYSITEEIETSYMRIVPRKISKALCLDNQVRVFMFIGDKNTVFTGDEDIIWETTDAIKTLMEVRISRRVVVALVRVNADDLETDSQAAFIGHCIGGLQVNP